MNQLHAVWGVAHRPGTLGGLCNLATVDIRLNSVVTNSTSEESLLHVRNYGSCTDYQSLDGNELVQICDQLAFFRAIGEILP